MKARAIARHDLCAAALLGKATQDMKNTIHRRRPINFNFERASCTLIATLSACLGVATSAQAQQAALSLPYLVQQAGLHHPSMQVARLEARASHEDQLAAQRQRWPALSVLLENANTGAATVTATRVLRV